MEDKKVTIKRGGVGFGGLLTIAFIVLKLTGQIAWPWVWVLCPLWISWGLILVAILFAVIATGIGALAEWLRWR